MSNDHDAYKQVALTLATHFDGLYYVDIKTGSYTEFVPMLALKDSLIPSKGKNFFKVVADTAKKCVHPDDIDEVLKYLDKKTMLKYLRENEFHVAIYRIIIDGEITHMRHVEYLSEDKEHIIFCAKNVEAEYKKEEEQQRNLQSAELLARLDDLTGIRNKTAFKERVKTLENSIKSKKKVEPFAVVMCDMNDLKRMNDTRGHSFGDEALQSASRMISEVFKNSPVYRIGGDEFVAILTDGDYKDRDKLLKQLRERSEANRNSRSGPVIASGLAIYHPEKDSGFDAVFKRADQKMYKNKSKLKSTRLMQDFRNMEKINKTIPPERKRLLDAF